jgi:hypothetical protein
VVRLVWVYVLVCVSLFRVLGAEFYLLEKEHFQWVKPFCHALCNRDRVEEAGRGLELRERGSNRKEAKVLVGVYVHYSENRCFCLPQCSQDPLQATLHELHDRLAQQLQILCLGLFLEGILGFTQHPIHYLRPQYSPGVAGVIAYVPPSAS